MVRSIIIISSKTGLSIGAHRRAQLFAVCAENGREAAPNRKAECEPGSIWLPYLLTTEAWRNSRTGIAYAFESFSSSHIKHKEFDLFSTTPTAISEVS